MKVGSFRLGLGGAHGATLDRDPRPTPATPRKRELPAPPSPVHALGVVDRERERAQVVALLSSHRIVRVGGASGVGTTTMLRQIASGFQDETLPDGSFYLHEASSAVDDVLARLYQLRFAEEAPRKLLEDELRRGLASLQAIVALDGASLSPEQLENFASYIPNSRVLVAETGLTDPGGPEAEPAARVALQPLAGYDAIALLEETLRRPIFGPARGAAEAICKTLGGIPSLIRWIGASARDDRRQLTDVARDLAEPGGLTRLFDASVNEAAPEQRAVISLLTATGTAIDRDLLAALTAMKDSENTLLALQRREFVVLDGEAYELTSAIAPYVSKGCAVIADFGRVIGTLHTHLESRAGEPMSGSSVTLTLRVLEAAFDASQWDGVFRLGVVASKAFALAARWDAWKSVLQVVRKAAVAVNDERHLAWSLHELGARAVALGENGAGALLKEALTLRAKLHDRAGERATGALLSFAKPDVEPPKPDDDTGGGFTADRALREAVRKKLAPYIGPIAEQVVADAATDARSESEFYNLCGQYLSANELARFLAAFETVRRDR